MRKHCRLLLYLTIINFIPNISYANELSDSRQPETLSVSEIMSSLKQERHSLIGKEIILSSCGVDVLECNECEAQAYVIHIDNSEYHNMESGIIKNYDKSISIRVYGNKREGLYGIMIGYNKCGLYQGTIQLNPYISKQKLKYQYLKYIFVVDKIIEEKPSEKEKQRIEKRKKEKELQYILRK